MYSKLWFIYLLHEAVLESLLCFYFFTMQLLVCLWYPVVVLYFSSFLSYLQLHIVFKKKKDYFNTADNILLWSSTSSVFCRMQKKKCLFSKSCSPYWKVKIVSKCWSWSMSKCVICHSLTFWNLKTLLQQSFLDKLGFDFLP